MRLSGQSPLNRVQQRLIVDGFSEVAGCAGFFGLVPGFRKIKTGDENHRQIRTHRSKLLLKLQAAFPLQFDVDDYAGVVVPVLDFHILFIFFCIVNYDDGDRPYVISINNPITIHDFMGVSLWYEVRDLLRTF